MTDAINGRPRRYVYDLPDDHWIRRQASGNLSLRGYVEAATESVLVTAARDAVREAGLSNADVARVLGVLPSHVRNLLGGGSNMTLRTFSRLLWAAGKQPRTLALEDVAPDRPRADKEE